MSKADLDVYPATLYGGETKHRKVRVIVADGICKVFDNFGGPLCVAVIPVTGFTRVRRNWEITTAAGGTLTVERLGGCGCGDPLKRAQSDVLMAMEVQA